MLIPLFFEILQSIPSANWSPLAAEAWSTGSLFALWPLLPPGLTLWADTHCAPFRFLHGTGSPSGCSTYSPGPVCCASDSSSDMTFLQPQRPSVSFQSTPLFCLLPDNRMAAGSRDNVYLRVLCLCKANKEAGAPCHFLH